MIEQPLAHDDLVDHARLQQTLTTAICLDESITSHDRARQALETGACRIVNMKVGRVGGYSEALRIHDLCVERGVPLWCGGMLESGIGRAHNVALASLPGFTLPGDISASRRYFERDVIVPPGGGGGGRHGGRPDFAGPRLRRRRRLPGEPDGVGGAPAPLRARRKVSRFSTDGLLTDLEALVVRESPSDDASAVTALARYIVERLRAAHVQAETRPCPPRGDAVLARVGEGAGGPLLLGHHDTVWPRGTLAEIPFRVEDGRVRGPGVFDMKAGIAVAIAVLADLARREKPPRVTLLLTPDEELGTGASRPLLLEVARAHREVLVLEPSLGGRGQGRPEGHGHVRGDVRRTRRPRGPRSRRRAPPPCWSSLTSRSSRPRSPVPTPAPR